MIVEPSVESLLKKCENRYELVIGVSRRARQMQNENNGKIESKVTKAAVEFHNGDCYIIGKNEEELNNNENIEE